MVHTSPSVIQQYHLEPTKSEHIRKRQTTLDVHHYPIAPKELALQQVHVYVRHGERAPVGVRLNTGPANIPEHWMLCKSAHSFRNAVADLLPHDGTPFRTVVERKDGTPADGQCLLGELTDVGRDSTHSYGNALRNLYVNRLGFLPRTISDPEAADQVYFRSTHVARTIESLQQMMRGVYPPSTWAAQNGIDGQGPVLRVRNIKDENLSGNAYSCPKLQTLLYGFAQAAASTYNHTLQPLDCMLSKYIGGNPIRVDGKPRASGIMDTIRAAKAHGIKVPPEFDDSSVVDLIENAVVAEWFDGYKTEEVRRLGMGPLLADVAAKMALKSGKGVGPRMLVHSTHDAGLAALLATLDVFDDAWPAFTASITFELFSKSDNTTRSPSYLQSVMTTLGRQPPSADYYIRMRYQNKNMILPLCAGAGDHLAGFPEFCTLNKFIQRVAELTPQDWNEECIVR
ncbi:phosphoglycerate mutase-like protein [Athelia psychrophila]|uniref:Phosphoglycerate mutase-like protein n=1 Tax=Athelia psychrophila TaxID=1759441 RepID=A0A166P3T4_9AGAM|nr:phosphoglycerate mutase-like protein [Fibularhizoctonia sp. CBS 109695]